MLTKFLNAYASITMENSCDTIRSSFKFSVVSQRRATRFTSPRALRSTIFSAKTPSPLSTYSAYPMLPINRAILTSGALALQDDSRLRGGQSARHEELVQVLHLVEVDVEEIEVRDLAAGVITHSVVTEVDSDADQVNFCRPDSTLRACEERDLDNTANTHTTSENVVRREHVCAVLVLDELEVDHGVGGDEQSRRALATVLGHRASDALDQVNTFDRLVQSLVDRVQFIVSPDRAELLRVDLVRVPGGTAVPDQNRASELLVQHDAHFLLDEVDHTEVGGLDDVLAVELLLLVDPGRVGLPLQELEDLFDLLGALGVTLRSSLIRRDVGVQALDPAMREASDAAKNVTHPFRAALDKVRLVGDGSGLREQVLDLVDAVLSGVLKNGRAELAAVLEGRLAHGVDLLASHGVLQLIGGGVPLEDVVCQLGVLRVRVFDVFGGRVAVLSVRCGLCIVALFVVELSFRSLLHEPGHDILLLIIHRVEDVGNGLLAAGILRFSLVCVLNLGTKRHKRLSFQFFTHAIRVSEVDLVDAGLRVGTHQYERHLDELAVHDSGALLLKILGVDRKRIEVAVLHQLAGGVGSWGVVECAESVHTVIAVLELSSAEDVLHGLASMLPHQRKRGAILVLECARRNRSTIRAQNIGPSGISRKVWFHFDLSLRDVHGGRRVFDREVRVSQLVCIRVGRRGEAKNRPELVGRDNLVTNQFVCKFCQLRDRNERKRIAECCQVVPQTPSGLSEELSPELFHNGLDKRLDRALAVVHHRSLVRGARKNLFSHSKLCVESLGEILDLGEQRVLNWPVELSDLLCSIGVSDAVLGAGKLLCDLGQTLFGLGLTSVRSDDVGQLEDKIKLVRRSGLISTVEKRELSREPLEGGVRCVEDSVERRLYNTDQPLREIDLIKLAFFGIEEFHPNILGEPLDYLADSDRFDVI
nr:MAG TPA: hypothetical protein [Caudoviricetes sp.]